MNTNRDGPASMTNRARMHLRYRDLDITTSWEEAHPGARASRPHKSWHSLTHLLDPDRTATAPWLCFGRAHAISTGRRGGLPHRRETERQPKGQHAGETPALPGGPSRWCGGAYPAGDFSESRPAPFGTLPFARGPGPATLPRGGSNEGETTNLPGLSGTRTLSG